MQSNSTWAPSPPSQAPWPAESFAFSRTIFVALGALALGTAVIMVYLAVAQFAGLLDLRKPQGIAPAQLLLAQLAAYVALGPYFIALLPAVSRMSLYQLGIRRPTARELGAGLLGTAAMWAVVATASTILETTTHRHDTETAIQLLRSVHTPLEKAAFVALAVVFAPLVEELMFRVFVFNALWRRMPLALAAPLSGAIFGAVHAGSRGQLLTIGLPLALGGVVLALVYTKTRCYWANVVTHAAFNGITVVAFFVFGVTS